MTAKQTTYVATFTTENGDDVATAERVSHRPLAFAAVVQDSNGVTTIPSFHTTEKLAKEGKLTAEQKADGMHVIATVPATVKVGDAPAPVEAPAEADPTPAQTLAERVDAAYAAAEVKRPVRKAASVKKGAKKAAQSADEATPSAKDIEKAVAELAAEPQAPTGTTGNDVVALYAYAAHTGKLGKSRAENLVTRFKRFVKVTGIDMAADVLSLDAEALVAQFEAKTPELLDKSQATYVMDFRRSLVLLAQYNADAAKFDPSVRTAPSAAKTSKRQSVELPVEGGTLRVVLHGDMDLKAALEAALASLTAEPATADA